MKTWVASVAAAAVSLSAIAHEGMHGPGAEYDDDENGSLSLKEYTTHLQVTKQDVSKAAEKFAALDVNKDGKVSGGEFARGQQAASKQK